MTGTATVTPVDLAINEAMALGRYLVWSNDGAENFLSRWAYSIADDLYRQTYGEIELDVDGKTIGRYAEFEAGADNCLDEILDLRELRENSEVQAELKRLREARTER